MLVDSHSHLFLDDFSEDLSCVIGRARAAGVTHIFMPNIDSTTIEPMLSVCLSYPDICFPMIGLHPSSVDIAYEKELAVVERELQFPRKYVAIGEIGLDLYWDKTFLEQQLIVFKTQVEWAIKYHLPIVIHSRDAFDYIYEILEPYKNSTLTGIFHSFTGTYEEAIRMMEFTGFKIGINGVVTFKKSQLPEILQNVPLDKIVLETDSPYLTPVPNRGKRNESANLKDTLIKVAEIYCLPFAEVAETTAANALKVFGILK